MEGLRGRSSEGTPVSPSLYPLPENCPPPGLLLTPPNPLPPHPLEDGIGVNSSSVALHHWRCRQISFFFSAVLLRLQPGRGGRPEAFKMKKQKPNLRQARNSTQMHPACCTNPAAAPRQTPKRVDRKDLARRPGGEIAKAQGSAQITRHRHHRRLPAQKPDTCR